jgi:hypothetical protein
LRLLQNLYNDYKSRTGARKLIDKMIKKTVLKTSICTGEQVAGFQDIHTGKIEEIMLIKQAADIDTFKQIYGINGEIPKVY